VTLLYLVHFVSRLPHGIESESPIAKDLKEREKARATELKEQGVWSDIVHPIGQDSWSCIFDVGSHDELHKVISSLPLFPYLEINVVPLR
jgi:muconolactone D-isomerase